MVDVLNCGEGGKPLVYFTGYGFEERSVRLLSMLGPRTRFKYAFSVGFPSSFLGNTLSWRRNKTYIDDRLADLAETYDTISMSVKEPVEVRQLLREKIAVHRICLADYDSVIDITSFPKSTLFMLLKELTDAGASGRLFYVEPVDYELPISLGVKDVRTLPFFGDDYDPRKRKLLIEILGFEGHRAHAVWETFDPHRTIALIGTPSLPHQKWLGIAERENRLVLSRHNVERRTISFTDLLDADGTLEGIHQTEGRAYNVIVSSLGTKLSAVALFYFANRHRNVFVAFSRPEEHTEHYSYGCSRLITVSFDSRVSRVASTIDLAN